MKNKVSWVLFTSALLLAMLLASCQTPSTNTGATTVSGKVVNPAITTPIEKQPSPSPAPVATEVPKYGGTIAFPTTQTGGFDPANNFNFWPSGLLCYETLISEDWTKGPSGSNQTPLASNYTPSEFYVGCLAERWEVVDLKTTVYQLRQGIKFMNKPPVNGREFTADDVVFNFNRYKTSAKSSWYTTLPADQQTQVTKVDKYTVKFSWGTASIYNDINVWINMQIVPREVVDKYGDLTDWRNMVTTGPFYVSDVVSDSSVTYKRNNEYWGMDPFHPKNQLPYVDNVKALVILDSATQLAALRTGKIARLGLTKEQADSMRKTNPELKYRRIAPSLTNIIHMRLDLKDTPYANQKVRQALSMAIDRQAIIKEYYLGDAEILNWPFQSTAGPLYTPFDQLPQNLKDIYSFNPTKAKQLLTEAGYPQGFKVVINVLAGYAGGVELYSIVKNYWDEIGVQTTLSSTEAGAYWSILVGHTYKDMTVSAWGNSHPNGGLAANRSGYLYNYSVVSDKYFDDELEAINQIVDLKTRTERQKKLGLYLIEKQYYIEMPSPYGYVFWQPWLKGQNGETQHGAANNYYGFCKYAWIDKTATKK